MTAVDACVSDTSYVPVRASLQTGAWRAGSEMGLCHPKGCASAQWEDG